MMEYMDRFSCHFFEDANMRIFF